MNLNILPRRGKRKDSLYGEIKEYTTCKVSPLEFVIFPPINKIFNPHVKGIVLFVMSQNNCRFKWIGEGHIARRRGKELHFSSFQNAGLNIKIGDFVLIRNDDTTIPESTKDCFIAQLKDLYDTRSNVNDHYRAVVQWYSRVKDIPSHHQQLLKDINYQQEIFQENRRFWLSDIDAETIFGKCSVILMPENVPGDSFWERYDSENNPVYYCKWKYNGSAFQPVHSAGENTTMYIDKKPKQRIQKTRYKTSVKRQSSSDSEKQCSESSEIGLLVPRSVIREKFPKRSCPMEDYVIADTSSSSNSIKLKIKKKSSLNKKHLLAKLQNSPIVEINESKLPIVSIPDLSLRNHTKDEIINEDVKSSNSSDKLKAQKFTMIKNKTKRKDKTLSEANTYLTRSGRKVIKKYFYSSDEEYMSDDGISRKISRKRVADDDEYQWESEATSSDNGYQTSKSDDDVKLSLRIKARKIKLISKQKKKALHINSLQTQIPVRDKPIKTKRNPLEEARAMLHVSAVPDSLPCREYEFTNIYSFIEGKLLDETGGCMYISGVPGTGKTVTVRDVMRTLKKERNNGQIPSFKFVEINGMKMTDPHQCYVQLLKGLTGKKVASDHACELLEKQFSNSGSQKEPVVVMVDELDLLWTRKQTVMYNLFDWPSRLYSKLIIIAIANTMDLPERMMKNRVISRLGLTRMTFQPYTFQQLQEIVISRIKTLCAFDPDAVQLIARKVAAISGDARRALELSRRAAEIAEEESLTRSQKKKAIHFVKMNHVEKALQEMFSSPMIIAMKSASLHEKIFLKSLVLEFQRTGIEEATFSRVFQQHVSYCRFEGISPPTTSEAASICMRLSSCRLLLVEGGHCELHQRIRLNVSTDDVEYALKEM